MFDINEVFNWIGEKYDNIINSIIEVIWSGFSYLVNLVPAPDFLLNMGNITIPSNVAYFANLFEFTFGLSIVSAAYIARFILRRIPVIG